MPVDSFGYDPRMTCPDPNVVTQLCNPDGSKRPDPTSGSDCGMAQAKGAIRFATCNKVSPSIEEIRKQSGLDEPNPPPDDYSTTVTELAKAINAFDDEATDRGFKGINAGVHERHVYSDLVEAIKREDTYLILFVDYGVLNDREPGKSGDKNFDGSHVVGVYGFKTDQETGDGTAKAKVFDSLCDGRKSGVPKGPTWWKMSTIKSATDAYTGGPSGTATWISIPRSERTDEPDPEPVPPPCSDQLAVAYDLLGEAVGYLQHGNRDERDLRKRILNFLPDTSEAATITVKPGVKGAQAY